MSIAIALILFTAFLILSRRLRNQNLREISVMGLNLALIYFSFFQENPLELLILIFIVVLHFYFLKVRSISIVVPVLTIFLYRLNPLYTLIGVSFVSFRLLSASNEITDGETVRPGLRQYLLYAFYLPTFKLGPIGRLKDHLDSWALESEKRWTDLNWSQLLRVSYGVVKCLFIAVLISNYSLSLDLDRLRTADSIKDIILMGGIYYAFSYFSFSGFNDIAIGLTHFLGWKMKENFDRPYLARNVGDFWSRWHISLTDILKEMLFYPMNQTLIRKFGKKSKFILTPLSFVILYLAIELWHGFSFNFVVLGIYYATGAITAFYFSQVFKFKDSKVVNVLSILLTQIYIAISFYIFQCDAETIKLVFERLIDLHL